MGREQRLRRRQPFGPRRQPLAAQLQRTQHRAAFAQGQFGDLVEQLGPDRNRHFGRRRRGRCAPVGGKIAQRGIGFVANRRNHRDRTVGDRADHHLFVESPQILNRAAAARDDYQIGPRHRSARLNCGKPADRSRDLLCRTIALNQHRPDQHLDRKAVCQAVQDIADHRPGRRSDHADHARHIGQRPLAFRREQPLGFKPGLVAGQQGQQSAFAGDFHPLDHQLIVRAARISGQLAGRDHLKPILGLEVQPLGGAAPHDRFEPRIFVL